MHWERKHRHNHPMGPVGRVPSNFGDHGGPSVFGPFQLLHLAVIFAVHCWRLTVLPQTFLGERKESVGKAMGGALRGDGK